MKRQLKRFSTAICMLAMGTATAQQADSLSITLNKQVLQYGDTLTVMAQYFAAPKLRAAATLQMVIENEKGHTYKMRWPILNGEAVGSLIIPDSLPKGKYNMSFAVQPKFFRIYGTVKPPIRTTVLTTNLLTGKGAWLSTETPVEEDGSFVIKNWLFEKDATLVFGRQKKVNSDLDISINTWLDSAYQPVAITAQEFYVGTPTLAPDTNATAKKNTVDASKFSQGDNLLPSVVVTGKMKTKADKFNEMYSSGLFSSMNERVFDFMSDNSDAFGYNSVLDYLQGRVAGLQMVTDADGSRTATWRGSNVSFYIDEMKVESDQINTLSTADIAIVKVYPPPFYGGSGGSGGGIAVYTRRGEYSANVGNKHVFHIKGYSPLESVLYFK